LAWRDVLGTATRPMGGGKGPARQGARESEDKKVPCALEEARPNRKTSEKRPI